jgi:hypothetical protein
MFFGMLTSTSIPLSSHEIKIDRENKIKSKLKRSRIVWLHFYYWPNEFVLK